MGETGGGPRGGSEAAGALLRRAAIVLFFLSGATGLAYEVVWLRLLVLVFGSAHFAVTAILTAFMAGTALGALAVGRWAGRGGIRWPSTARSRSASARAHWPSPRSSTASGRSSRRSPSRSALRSTPAASFASCSRWPS